MTALGSQLDGLWETLEPDGWVLEENAGPIAMRRRAARRWIPSGANSHYAWLYFRRQDASALIVKAARDSVLLQSQGGARRIVVIEQGMARIWVSATPLTLMEGDRIWIDREFVHLIEPLTPKVAFELICWPEMVGLPAEGVEPPLEPMEKSA